MHSKTSPSRGDDGGVAAGGPASARELDRCLLASSLISQSLGVVGRVVSVVDTESESFIARVNDLLREGGDNRSLQDWLNTSEQLDLDLPAGKHILKLSIALAYLRQAASDDTPLLPNDLASIWHHVQNALQSPSLNWETQRTTDGWYRISLWKVPKDDSSQEQIVIEIWMPDEAEGAATEKSHEPESCTKSWPVAGQGLPKGQDFDREALHAALVFYDTSSVRIDTTNTSDLRTADIARAVSDVRSWKVLQDTGSYHVGRGEWEEALRAFRTALHQCQYQHDTVLARPRYEHVSRGKIGYMRRMMGRYDEACKELEIVVIGTPQSRYRVDSAGELAMVYRHMNRLEDSKRAAEDQYRGAKELGLAKFACRSIGNIGMVNYQLYLENEDPALLEQAISQLNERVERAQQIEDVALEAIGQSRLSLCYIAQKDYETAVKAARQNYALMCKQADATKTGFAKAFLGRTLHIAGHEHEALAVFNQAGGCPPIIALCREISDEHRSYIEEMINWGADLKMRDEQGYSALECSVYNGDEITANIIRQGLVRQIQRENGNARQEMGLFEYESTLRRGYRNMFQDRLRPVLLKKDQISTLRDLRDTYAAGLQQDQQAGQIFDRLKYVRYSDFVRRGRLPASRDPDIKLDADVKDPFIIFFSYRWLAKNPGTKTWEVTPDDDHNTQYKRMLKATEKFLATHSEIERDRLCIWLDFACVDQNDTKPGVAALPMNLAQCSAMISLIDKTYYERSWCCVEVLMIQTLVKSYGLHLWYEHVEGTKTTEGSLSPGPLDMHINLAEKKVTYETDRMKLQFLERQTRLLG